MSPEDAPVNSNINRDGTPLAVLIVWPAIVLPQYCAEPPAPRAKSDTGPAKSLQWRKRCKQGAQQLVHHRAAGEIGPSQFSSSTTSQGGRP
jgi:hypothetical protein